MASTLATAVGLTYMFQSMAGSNDFEIFKSLIDPTGGRSITNPFSPNFMAVVLPDAEVGPLQVEGGTRMRLFQAITTPARAMFAPIVETARDYQDAREQAKLKGEGTNAITLMALAGMGAPKHFSSLI